MRQQQGANLLGALDSKADMAGAVTNHNEGLETGALTGAGLLLHRHDLHNLVLQGGGGQEGLHNLVLLDGQGEQEDVLQALYLALVAAAGFETKWRLVG